MKPRERVKLALSHQEADRVPRFIRYVGAVKDKLKGVFDSAGIDLELKMGNDAVMVQIGINGEYSHRVVPEGEKYTSEWGVTYQRVFGFNQPVDYPLKEQKLDNYNFPDPYAPWKMEEIKSVMDKYHNDYYVIVDLSCTLFEAGFHLRGMENFVMDAYEDPEFTFAVIEGLEKYYTALGVEAIKQGIDMIRIGDDVGVQTGLIMPPDKWREIVKPSLHRMIKAFKKANPDIAVKYHSCGDFSTIIPDMVEMGVDLLGTMQPCGAMDHSKLKAEYGDKISFLGGLDVQQLLPSGSPAEVRKGVKEVLRAYAQGGGYIFMPAHYVNVDVPVENLWAMLEAVKEFGDYPLNIPVEVEKL